MLVPNRHASAGEYRYGFQGQEKDDEVKGEGNSLNYTFRMHDPRIGRFFAIDPLTKEYPHYTPYSFSGNKPIQFVELEGLEEGMSTAAMLNNWEKQDNLHTEGKITTAELIEKRTQSQYSVTLGAVLGIMTRGGFHFSRAISAGGVLEALNESERGYDAQKLGNKEEAQRRFDNAGEATKFAVFEGIGIISFKGIGKIYDYTQKIKNTSLKLNFIRETFKIGKGKNIAWIEGKIGEESIGIIAHSGSKSSKMGTADVPGIARFFETNVARNNSFDAEIKILESLANKYKNNKTITGEITIYSERKFCDSCSDALFKQFKEIFPNIKIKVGANGIKK